MAFLLTPVIKRRLLLTVPEPGVAPRFYTGYLTDSADRDAAALVEGFRLLRRAVASDAEIDVYVRGNVIPTSAWSPESGL